MVLIVMTSNQDTSFFPSETQRAPGALPRSSLCLLRFNMFAMFTALPFESHRIHVSDEPPQPIR